MPYNVPFIISLKEDLKARRLTYDDAAAALNMSKRQFARYIRGETKQGMMPVEIVADLRDKELVSVGTASCYVDTIRHRLRCKKKGRSANRLLESLLNILS